MPPFLFMDSSALFTGVASPTGAARALLVLAEAGKVSVVVSEQVLAETERALARKLPQALPSFRKALRSTGIRIVPDPTIQELAPYRGLISHEADLPILVAAMREEVGFLVTHNDRHFLRPEVQTGSGLRIGSPGNGLRWLLEQLTAS